MVFHLFGRKIPSQATADFSTFGRRRNFSIIYQTVRRAIEIRNHLVGGLPGSEVLSANLHRHRNDSSESECEF